MKTLAPLLLALCALVCSCSSREEQIADLGKTTAHNWLEWKYNPAGRIEYSGESVHVCENSLTGNYWVSYTANIRCTTNSLRPASIADSVCLEYEYVSADEQCVLKSQSITSLSK